MKIKKFLWVLVSILMIISMVSCTSAGTPTTAVAAKKGIKVANVCTQTIGSPFEIAKLAGLNKAVSEGIISELKTIELKEPKEYVDALRSVSEQGYDLVISTFGGMLEPMQTVSAEFPKTKYLLLNAFPKKPEDYPNLRSIVFKNQDGTYLTGVMAALLSKNKHVCYVGGGVNDTIVRFFAGFEAGAKSVDPAIKIDVAWANTWTDPVKGQELANAFIDRGCDVIGQAANQTGLGVIKACEEAKVWTFGVDVDQSSVAPDVVAASALTPAGDACYLTAQKIVNDKWESGLQYFGVAEGGNMIAFGTAKIPDEVIAKVKQVQADIAAGKVQIPTTTETR